jgi:hypothetical protein
LNVFRGYYCLALDYYLEDKSVKNDAIAIAEKVTSGDQGINGSDDDDDDLESNRIDRRGDCLRTCRCGYFERGQYKFGPIIATLPPLGEGLKKLREALQPISATEIHRQRPKRLHSAQRGAARGAAGLSAAPRRSAKTT